jgi:hypothetical protein
VGNDFLAPPRRRFGPLLVAGVLVAVTVTVLVTIAVVRPGPARALPRPAGPGTASSSVSQSIAASASPVPSVSPVGQDAAPLGVVHGARMVDGVGLGYPHTLVGAVSAAVEFYTQLGCNLDPDRGKTLGSLIAVSAWRDAPQVFAQAALAARKQFGLPVTGPVPQGASTVLDPVEFQTRNATSDRVEVVLLAYLTVTTPAQGVENRLGVFPILIAWERGDWRWTNQRQPSDVSTDYQALSAQPGSPQAAALGWRELDR